MKYALLLSIGLIAFFTSCKKDNEEITVLNNSRADVVKAITQQQIIPHLKEALSNAEALQLAVNKLNTPIYEPNLSNAQIEWEKAAISTSQIEYSLIGEAKYTYIYPSLYTWPADTSRITDNASQSTDTNFVYNTLAAAKGMAAMEYMLFGSHNQQISWLEQDYRTNYLQQVAAAQENKTKALLAFWQNTYAKEFQVNPSESISLIFNGLIQTLENIKNKELGEPLGLNGSSADSVLGKAFYSNANKLLVSNSLATLHAVYGSKNEGFDLLIRELSLTHSEELANQVQELFERIHLEIEQSPKLWNDAIHTTNQDLVSIHSSITELIRLLKADVASHLSITITLSDSDGD